MTNGRIAVPGIFHTLLAVALGPVAGAVLLHRYKTTADFETGRYLWRLSIISSVLMSWVVITVGTVMCT